jgi:hypothetical protein
MIEYEVRGGRNYAGQQTVGKASRKYTVKGREINVVIPIKVTRSFMLCTPHQISFG